MRVSVAGLTAAIAVLSGSLAAAPLAINAGTPTAVEFEAPALREPGHFRAAILADRTNGWPEGLQILAAAVEEIREASPDFVLTVGDMINGYTRHEEDWLREFEEEWQRFVEPLGLPIYYTPGNHDTWPGQRRADDHSNERLYREHFGPLHYSFDVGRAHFVILYSDDGLDSRRPAALGAEQLAWLEADLREMDADHLFVLMHRPLWAENAEQWDTVHGWLVATGKARAVIAGHWHTYQRFPDRDGIAYLVLGATGGSTRRARLAGGLQHWSLLTVEGDRWQIETKEVGGEWLPSDFVLSQDAERFGAIMRLDESETGPLNPLPVPGPGAIRDTPLMVRVTNPLDQEVSVTMRLAPGRGDAWTMSPSETRITLAPRASQELALRLSHPEIEGAPQVEAQLDFVYELTDSRGRSVPVTVPRRLGWNMEWRLYPQPQAQHKIDGIRGPLEGWEGAMTIGLPTWETAPWETREGPAEVRLSWGGGDDVYLYFSFPDDRLEDFPENHSSWPSSDAVVLRSCDASGENERALALFPLREGERRALRVVPGEAEVDWPPVEGVEIATRHHNFYPEIQRWEMRVPLAAWLGEDWRPGPTQRVNLELHDNDGRHFSSVRSWTPRGGTEHWAVFAVGQRPPEELIRARPASPEARPEVPLYLR